MITNLRIKIKDKIIDNAKTDNQRIILLELTDMRIIKINMLENRMKFCFMDLKKETTTFANAKINVQLPLFQRNIEIFQASRAKAINGQKSV